MRRLKELLSALYENEDRYIEKIFDSEDSVDESIIASFHSIEKINIHYMSPMINSL